MPEKEGCLTPVEGAIQEPEPQQKSETPPAENGGIRFMSARVGHPAPDFVANAFHQGQAKQVKLSDHKGEWIVLCFYPGDFTFV